MNDPNPFKDERLSMSQLLSKIFSHLPAFLLLVAVSSVIQAAPANAEIPWHRTRDSAVEAAQVSGKPILVFVTADWCHYCQKMKQETWRSLDVERAVSQQFETLVLDPGKNSDIVQRLGVESLPTTMVFQPDGTLIARKEGFMPAKSAIRWLGDTIRR